jgi:translation elongation factor EF-Tu-like GTPase
MAEIEIGKVAHFFGRPMVAAVEITSGTLKKGDTIRILGHTTDFTQTVESMQIEHEIVEEAQDGDSIGIKVREHAREHDRVFKITEQ